MKVVELNEQQKSRYLSACDAPADAVVMMTIKKTVAEVEVTKGLCVFAKWHVNLRTASAHRVI